MDQLILANDPFIIENKLDYFKLLAIYAHHERQQYLIYKRFVFYENGLEHAVITPLIFSDNDS